MLLDFLKRRRCGKKEGGKEKEGEEGFHDWRGCWWINRISLFQVLVGEVQVLFPVIIGHVVFSRAYVVADSPMDGLVDRGLFPNPEFVAEQFVDWFRA